MTSSFALTLATTFPWRPMVIRLGAFHATVDKKRFGAAQFALDNERASDGGLLHRWGRRLDWDVAVCGGRWRILWFRRLQHV